jgi:hypothetical protein
MRRAPIAPLLAALAAALSGCGGPLLYAELEVPTLRATMPEQAFPASDTTNPADWCAAVQDPVNPCIQLTTDYDLGGMVPILNEPNVTYDLRLTDVAITLAATEVGKDLSGIQRVTLSALADPNDPSSTVVIAGYVRPASGNPPQAIAVTGNSNLDLGPYLRGGVLKVHAELVLDAGTPAFTADVTSGFSLLVTLDYGSLL